MSTHFAALLLPALEAEARAAFCTLDDLEALLAQLYDAGRKRWPALDVSAEDFVPYLAARLPSSLEPEDCLAAVNGADLYLACGCVLNIAGAARLLEEHFGAELDGVYRHIGTDVVAADDFRQLIWERVLVSGDGPPRMATYRGRGQLGAWLRMTARRTLLNLIRDAGRRPVAADDETLVDRLEVETDDAMSGLDKAQHRQWFKEAFAAALADLKPEERNLLRYRFVNGLPMQEAADILGIHRVSASRSLARIRARLLESVRRTIEARIGPASDLFAEFTRVQSKLELSLSRLLG